LRTVRVVDKSLADQRARAEPTSVPVRRARDFDELDPGRPSIEQKRDYYWSGPGWHLAYNEACRLLSAGESIADAAAAVGWTKQDLEDARKRGGTPPKRTKEDEEAFKPRERARRTVKQRVAGLRNVDPKKAKLAKRLYEIEVMTVREVARTLGEPYEKTYLILILAGTKFRRPGRRSREPILPEKPVVERIRPRRMQSVSMDAETVSDKEKDLALRRALGQKKGATSMQKPAPAGKSARPKPVAPKKRASERSDREKDLALKRALRGLI
jgi:hypothetical protein